jgi:hypothetical protein
MIVWGTGGDKETNKRMYDVAQIGRRLSRPGWPGPTELVDGIPMVYSIYGRLPGKPDSEVTEADMMKYNLLLIGTERQNSVVAKLSKDLPVKIKGGRVGTTDGLSWDCNDCAVGLLYYNPLAPKRLIYWVGSDSADFYKADSPLMKSQFWSTASPDFLIMHATKDLLVAARRFNSRWEWEKGYADSPLMKEELCNRLRHLRDIAEILRQKSGADFTLYTTDLNAGKQAFAPGQTRWMDILAQAYYDRVATMELSGQEILDNVKAFDKAREAAVAEKKAKQEATQEKQESAGEPVWIPHFFPEPRPEDIEPKKTYSVVSHVWDVDAYVEATHRNPESLRHLAVTMREVLK